MRKDFGSKVKKQGFDCPKCGTHLSISAANGAGSDGDGPRLKDGESREGFARRMGSSAAGRGVVFDIRQWERNEARSQMGAMTHPSWSPLKAALSVAEDGVTTDPPAMRGGDANGDSDFE